MIYTIYSVLTGVVRSVGSCPEWLVSAQIDDADTQAAIKGLQLDPERFLVDPGTGTPTEKDRLPCEIAFGHEEDGGRLLEIRNVRRGSIVSVFCTQNGNRIIQETVNDGEFFLNVKRPGRYRVVIEHDQHLSMEEVFDAT